MAYCPNDATKLVLSEENTLSKDRVDVTHYTHYCTNCNRYWHLHFSDSQVTLSSSEEADVGRFISTNLVEDLDALSAKLKES